MASELYKRSHELNRREMDRILDEAIEIVLSLETEDFRD